MRVVDCDVVVWMKHGTLVVHSSMLSCCYLSGKNKTKLYHNNIYSLNTHIHTSLCNGNSLKKINAFHYSHVLAKEDTAAAPYEASDASISQPHHPPVMDQHDSDDEASL